MEILAFAMKILFIVAVVLFVIAFLYTVIRVIANGKKGLKAVKEALWVGEGRYIHDPQMGMRILQEHMKRASDTGTSPIYQGVGGNIHHDRHYNTW